MVGDKNNQSDKTSPVRDGDSSNGMKDIVALCKRRGIIFPGSEIYGGMANTWDYGPYGVLLKNNVKKAWWDDMVMKRADIVGLDSGILMNPRVWEASGHTKAFVDPLLECKKCKTRHKWPDDFPGVKMSKGGSYTMKQDEPKCPRCGERIDAVARDFNLMFKTHVGPVADLASLTYLRPETAQGIFVNFKNVLDSTRVKMPFGIAQIGKAFRNEITPGNFIFRTLEFEQFEMEYFVRDANEAKKVFDEWKETRMEWFKSLGIKSENLKFHEHAKDELAHYAVEAIDIEYNFPFGFSELEGIHNRGDYDLKQHQEHSKQKLEYTEEDKKILPHVVETSGGVDRAVLAFLVDAYDVDTAGDSERTVLRLHPKLAPIKVAILPLVKKEPVQGKAKEIYENLKGKFFTEYDESGTVGKRYRRQDEIGTPFCVTVDFDNLENDAVTVRHRDSMEQDVVKIDELEEFFGSRLI